MRRGRQLVALVVAWIAIVGAPARAATASAAGGWMWPVVGPVIRGFDAPDSAYGPGHRGIDIAATTGVAVVAPAPGVVTFAGQVGGHLYVSVAHGGGYASTYSWLSARLVSKGDVVAAGTPLALSGTGHPGSVVPHLHFGVKLDATYVDPLDLLAPASVEGFIRLAPLDRA